jgi:hypothetical protein
MQLPPENPGISGWNRIAQDQRGRLGFVVAHPSVKNKDVARMGHPKGGGSFELSTLAA